MKKLLLLFAFVFAVCCTPVQADLASIVASTNNITTAFGSGAGSQILASQYHYFGIQCLNTTATAVEISYGERTCASGNAAVMVVLASGSNAHTLRVPSKGNVCVRSTSGTISAGTVYCETVY